MSGIQVANGAGGTVPAYGFVTEATREYEICFKCHSSWTTQPAGQSNLAVKFNANNLSYHPVEAAGKNTGIKALSFVNGWTDTKLMYCSDCHTSDTTTVRGPHGSANRYILKKPYTASSAYPVTMAATPEIPVRTASASRQSQGPAGPGRLQFKVSRSTDVSVPRSGSTP